MSFSVVCWLWKPHKDYRSKFNADHVNVLRAMVARHFHIEHDFVCITDQPHLPFDRRVEVIKLWDDFASVPSPHGEGNPSCYRRLKAFSKEMKPLLGDKFVSIDLDCVVTDDVTPLWDRPDDFMIWKGTSGGNPYNGSMWMMEVGARSKVWDDFDPVESPRLARQMKYYGSDQAWMGACLGRHEKTWSKRDGVFSYRKDVVNYRGRLPQGARIVFFHGSVDPWNRRAQRSSPWITDHWKL